jgi:molybdopterin-containing oxidoreductase family membrane subunit
MKFEKNLAVRQEASPHRSSNIALLLPIAMVAAGIAGPVYGQAHEATGGLEHGLLIVCFLFLLGVSQAGVVFCAILRLSRAQWSKPYYRIAELYTMAFSPFAIIGFLLIYIYAKEDLFYWLSASPDDHINPWLNINWLLIRQIFGLLLFYGLSAVYVIKALRPDLPGGSNIDQRKVEQELYFMSPLILIAFVICNTFIAWDFAMMIIPHWHSTVFPIHYWFGNVYAGTASLLAVPVIFHRSANTAGLFGPQQIRYISMMITSFMLLWLYLYWAQFFVVWFGNLPHEFEPVWRQMFGHYAPYYWTMMAGCFFVPFVCLIFAIINRSLLAMCILGIGINIGIWVNKYLMVIPVYSTEAQLLDNMLDIGLSIGLLAAFLVVLVLLARIFPAFSNWEINLKPDTSESFEADSGHGSIHP